MANIVTPNSVEGCKDPGIHSVGPLVDSSGRRWHYRGYWSVQGAGDHRAKTRSECGGEGHGRQRDWARNDHSIAAGCGTRASICWAYYGATYTESHTISRSNPHPDSRPSTPTPTPTPTSTPTPPPTATPVPPSAGATAMIQPASATLRAGETQQFRVSCLLGAGACHRTGNRDEVTGAYSAPCEVLVSNTFCVVARNARKEELGRSAVTVAPPDGRRCAR